MTPEADKLYESIVEYITTHKPMRHVVEDLLRGAISTGYYRIGRARTPVPGTCCWCGGGLHGSPSCQYCHDSHNVRKP